MSAAPTRRALLGGAGISAAALVVAPAAVVAMATGTRELEAAFAAWQHAMRTIHDTPASVTERHLAAEWRTAERAEAAILNAPDGTPRVAVMRIWIGLAHLLPHREQERAAIRCDLRWLLQRADTLDWDARMFVNALAAVEGKVGAVYRGLNRESVA